MKRDPRAYRRVQRGGVGEGGMLDRCDVGASPLPPLMATAHFPRTRTLLHPPLPPSYTPPPLPPIAQGRALAANCR